MKRVICILEDGFEEIEAITPVNLMRRAGVEVTIAGFSKLNVTGKCGIHILADILWADCSTISYDGLLLPGGPAVMSLRADSELIEFIRKFHSDGKPIGAICAAPLLLHDAGVLSGMQFTSHFSTHHELTDSSSDPVLVDKNLCTARGAGTSLKFGLAFLSLLLDEQAAKKVALAIMAV